MQRMHRGRSRAEEEGTTTQQAFIAEKGCAAKSSTVIVSPNQNRVAWDKDPKDGERGKYKPNVSYNSASSGTFAMSVTLQTRFGPLSRPSQRCCQYVRKNPLRSFAAEHWPEKIEYENTAAFL